ncbi:phosphatase PAP2 family protein [Acidobacteria bacterium AB60]|nr:phosphatase PAP2 family protein [Acidobacteria bacterium AB60]
MRSQAILSFLTIASFFAILHPAVAQDAPPSGLPDVPKPLIVAPEDGATLRNTPRNLLKDQMAIWTSPLHLRPSNAAGPVVLVAATVIAMTTDHQAMSSSRLQDASLNSHANTASNGLLGGLVVIPAALYGVGALQHRAQPQETGILAGEAMVDSLAVNEVMKLVAQRERPTVDNARGRFFQSGVGTGSSFPSNHAILAWSSAAVVASEYPGFLSDVAIYGLATGVSVTRVVARQHFPSDVLVGSAVGWMIGRYVFRHHQRSHDMTHF